MRVSIRGFIFHKEAETFEDCFDRYAINLRNHKFCVSDGVSKSFFPGLWAELLTNSFVENIGKIDLTNTDVFKSTQRKWNDEVLAIANRPNQKYYVKNFYAQGRSAAATFVGLNLFFENGKPHWEAYALGDSFLFFVPDTIINLDDQFSEILYVTSKKNFEFDNFPDFFDSIHSLNKGKIRQTKHELKSGKFYIMTDALSEWFINAKQSAISEIETWHSQEIFEERIKNLRKKGLHNDDSAILVIDIQEDNSYGINYGDVNVSDLKKLRGIFDDERGKKNYKKETEEIERKFLSTPHKYPLVSEINVYDKKSNQRIYKKPEYLAKRDKKKEKKKGFFDGQLQIIRGFISSVIFDKKRTPKKENAKEIPPIKTLKQKNDNGDIDSITNKF